MIILINMAKENNMAILFRARFQIMTEKFCQEYFMLMTLLRHAVAVVAAVARA